MEAFCHHASFHSHGSYRLQRAVLKSRKQSVECTWSRRQRFYPQRRQSDCHHSVGQYSTRASLSFAESETQAVHAAGQEGIPSHADIIIVGAGVAGLATACALNKLGFQVLVLERSPSLPQAGSALSLWGNAWLALERLGVAESLRHNYCRLMGIDISSSEGKSLRSFDFADTNVGPHHEVRGLDRAALLTALSSDLPAGCIRFDAAVTSIVDGPLGDGGFTSVTLAEGLTVTCNLLLACDGCSSVVAQHLGLPAPSFVGQWAVRGVAEAETEVEAGGGGGDRQTWDGSSGSIGGDGARPANSCESNNSSSVDVINSGGSSSSSSGSGSGSGRIRMVFGEGVRAGFYPLSSNRTYWFVTCNGFEDMPRLTGEPAAAQALKLVSGWPPHIASIIRSTPPSSLSFLPLTDRLTSPLPLSLWHRGAVAVAGDAAHPMTPNLGQGACCALEDAVVLARCIAEGAAREASGVASDRGGPQAAARREQSLVSAAARPLAVQSSLADSEMIGGQGSSEAESEASSTDVAANAVRGNVHTLQRRREVVRSSLPSALSRFERERVARAARLTLQSRVVGALLQLPVPAVCWVRDQVVLPHLFSPYHFLDHAIYDCGSLPLEAGERE